MKSAAVRLSKAIASVYDAALGCESWETALGNIGSNIGSRVAALNVCNGGNGGDRITVNVGLDPAYLKLYDEHYHSTNIHIQKGLNACPAFAFTPSQAFVTDHEVLASEHYNGWLKPQGLQHLMGAVMPGPARSAVLIAFLRSPADGTFNSADAEVGDIFLPHISRAILIVQQLAIARMDAEARNRLPFGLILLSVHGVVLWANNLAQEILARRDGLFLDSEDVLCSNGLDSNVRRVVAEVLASQSGSAPSYVKVHRRNGVGRSYVLVCSPACSRQAILSSNQPALVVRLIDTECKLRLDPRALELAFDLTPAETRIAVLMARGHSVGAIQKQLRIRSSTIRTHIHHLHQKLGVTHQTDLVAVVSAHMSDVLVVPTGSGRQVGKR